MEILIIVMELFIIMEKIFIIIMKIFITIMKIFIIIMEIFITMEMWKWIWIKIYNNQITEILIYLAISNIMKLNH